MRQREWRLLTTLIALVFAYCWLSLLSQVPSGRHAGKVRGLPGRVREAAYRALPGLHLRSYRPERFNGKPAWELMGQDAQGGFRRLDIYDSGEVIMIESD